MFMCFVKRSSVINSYFCIDVTFEMRTVLNGIRLLIDYIKSPDSIFISNGESREESRVAERQKERVCVRGSALRKRRDGVSDKMSR
jgi:hypothetical protein